MTDSDAVQELRERAAELERSAKAIEQARVERASAQPPEQPAATAPAAAEQAAAPTIGQGAAELGMDPAAVATAARQVPRPGTRLTSDGLDRLLEDPAAYGAYEDGPGGREELRRVQAGSRGRRI
jgi:hypothetical protein